MIDSLCAILCGINGLLFVFYGIRNWERWYPEQDREWMKKEVRK